LPLSSHTFNEPSAHVLAVTPTAHYLEFLDLAGALMTIFMMSIMARSLAPAATALAIPRGNHQFSPVWIGTPKLMVDYNQSQTVPSALERIRRLEAFDLAWVEEPVRRSS
jgi:hypothetical protein